ncbi:MAG: Mammalian cell entry related domain protein [Gemmatimonadetes bacterium]|jgi:phospholipid/cholesterol/gamma-HCH transport system substrate-binding protein|nr:Mammalian cell entry related domain protein [Gemmatimonadota bacterium]
MARELSWSDVRGGVIAFVVLVVTALSIIWFLRVGQLRGESYVVYALVSEAAGLTPGSEVWLSGQKVGKVRRISFRSPATADTATRLLLELQLLSEHREAIHRDADAQIRAGGSLIGAVVVNLTPGTTSAPTLAEGDTLRASPPGVVEGAVAQVRRAMSELPPLMDTVGILAKQVQSPGGTIGAFMTGPGLRGLDEAQRRTASLVGRVTKGRGTAGLVFQGGLGRRASGVMARADSVRALLASSRTSLGRFRRDSTLLREVASIRAELAEVQRALDEPRGTAGRVLRDSALTDALASAQQEMTLLFADLKKHPFRYISF